MKTVIASLLLTITVITGPAFARNGARNSGHDQGNAVYQDHSRIGDYGRSDADQRIIDAISRNDWSAGK